MRECHAKAARAAIQSSWYVGGEGSRLRLFQSRMHEILVSGHDAFRAAGWTRPGRAGQGRARTGESGIFYCLGQSFLQSVTPSPSSFLSFRSPLGMLSRPVSLQSMP